MRLTRNIREKIAIGLLKKTDFKKQLDAASAEAGVLTKQWCEEWHEDLYGYPTMDYIQKMPAAIRRTLCSSYDRLSGDGICRDWLLSSAAPEIATLIYYAKEHPWVWDVLGPKQDFMKPRFPGDPVWGALGDYRGGAPRLTSEQQARALQDANEVIRRFNETRELLMDLLVSFNTSKTLLAALPEAQEFLPPEKTYPVALTAESAVPALQALEAAGFWRDEKGGAKKKARKKEAKK